MTIIDLGSLDPATAEPVSVAALKEWARIDRDDEDELIEALGRAARETVEATTGLALSVRRFRLVLDSVPANGWIELVRRPLGTVTAIAAYGRNGERRDFDIGEAVIERVLGVEAIRLSPAVRQAATNGVEVEFEAGFTPESVPEDIRLALKKIVATSYELRGAVPVGQQPAILPRAATALVAPYRRIGL